MFDTTTARRPVGTIARTIGSFIPALLLGITFAFCAYAAPVARPNVTGLDAPSAARMLSASGVRVLAIGLSVAPDRPRGTTKEEGPNPAANEPDRREQCPRRDDRPGLLDRWGGHPVGDVVPPAGVRAVPYADVFTPRGRR